MKNMIMVLIGLLFLTSNAYAGPNFPEGRCVTATSANPIPAANDANAIAARVVIQDLTYTAVTKGTSGNSITVAYVAGGTTGAEVVTVVGNAISVSMHTAVSTATQIRAAINASAAATALVTCTVSGTGATAQNAVSATPLANGDLSHSKVLQIPANSTHLKSHNTTSKDMVVECSTGTSLAAPSDSSTHNLKLPTNASFDLNIEKMGDFCYIHTTETAPTSGEVCVEAW